MNRQRKFQEVRQQQQQGHISPSRRSWRKKRSDVLGEACLAHVRMLRTRRYEKSLEWCREKLSVKWPRGRNAVLKFKFEQGGALVLSLLLYKKLKCQWKYKVL
jgi:hypothetical protein